MIPNAQIKQADNLNPATLFTHPKMAQSKLISKLIEAMDERYKKFLLYGTLEGVALCFYFSHNGIAYEFMEKVDEFRAKIIPIYKKYNMRETLYFTTIKAKTKHRPIKKAEPKEPNQERAKGTFEIEARDPAIQSAFKKLRETIKNSHKEQK